MAFAVLRCLDSLRQMVIFAFANDQFMGIYLTPGEDTCFVASVKALYDIK